MNNYKIGSWILFIDTQKSWWSNDFYELLGYKPNQIEPTAEAGFNHIHVNDRERAQIAVTNAIATHGEYDITKRIVKTNGEVRIVRSLGRIVEVDGDLVLAGMLWDLGPWNGSS